MKIGIIGGDSFTQELIARLLAEKGVEAEIVPAEEAEVVLSEHEAEEVRRIHELSEPIVYMKARPEFPSFYKNRRFEDNTFRGYMGKSKRRKY